MSSLSAPSVSEDIPQDLSRYSRQIFLPDVGIDGQLRLQKSSVLVVGAGGLGCACSLNLALNGVGKIGIVDHDIVELHNIHRQVLHKEDFVGKLKVDSVVRELTDRCKTSYVEIKGYPLEITSLLTTTQLDELCAPYDIICDCTDSVDVRYILGDYCALRSKPLVGGDAVSWDGHCTIFNYGDGPCLRCIHPTPPERRFVKKAVDIGVMGCVVNIISTIQALETMKTILGFPSLSGKLFIFDGKKFSTRIAQLRSRNPDCTFCGRKKRESEGNEDENRKQEKVE